MVRPLHDSPTYRSPTSRPTVNITNGIVATLENLVRLVLYWSLLQSTSMALFTPTITARAMRFDVDDFDFTPSDDEIGTSPEETVGSSPSDQPGTSSAGQVVPDDVISSSPFTMDDFDFTPSEALIFVSDENSSVHVEGEPVSEYELYSLADLVDVPKKSPSFESDWVSDVENVVKKTAVGGSAMSHHLADSSAITFGRRENRWSFRMPSESSTDSSDLRDPTQSSEESMSTFTTESSLSTTTLESVNSSVLTVGDRVGHTSYDDTSEIDVSELDVSKFTESDLFSSDREDDSKSTYSTIPSEVETDARHVSPSGYGQSSSGLANKSGGDAVGGTASRVNKARLPRVKTTAFKHRRPNRLPTKLEKKAPISVEESPLSNSLQLRRRGTVAEMVAQFEKWHALNAE